MRLEPLSCHRVTVADIEKELAELRESQERGKISLEHSVSEASLYLQDQVRTPHSSAAETRALLGVGCRQTSLFYFIFPFFDPAHGMQNFPGQGSNPCHSRDNAGSLTH